MLITLTSEELKRRFDDFSEPSEGLIAVRDNGSHYHILLDGTPAYEERYDKVGSFSEGLAVVQKDGECFHIRHDGTPAYKERYNQVAPFSEGLAAVNLVEVKVDSKWFHIRHDGTPAYEERFEIELGPFHQGLAFCYKGHGHGHHIRSNGSQINGVEKRKCDNE